MKKLFKKILSMNREYLLLFAVLAALGFLIYSTTAVSQEPPEEIIISTLYPAPFGEFNELSFKLARDYDNPMNRWVDPAGMSMLETLRVVEQLITGYIAGPPTPGPATYTVNFTNGEANFNVVDAQRYYMDDPGPLGPDIGDQNDPLIGDKDEVRAIGRLVYDIAEGVYAKDCVAGDVVLISDNDQTDVMKSTGSFANRIAGVISGNPTIYMGSHKQKVPLALAGIVKCNASAENGSIKRGDLLVTASLPGHAMKADPHEVKPGMVIGKAMESLKENTGKILILVNR